MKRRDLTLGLLLATAVGTVRAEALTKQHRIAIISTRPVAQIDDPTIPVFRAFFEELRRLGDVEGPNLTIERYSGGGRPAGYPDLAREVVARNPDVIVALGNPMTQAVRAATGTIPIVWIGSDPIQEGFATSLARPGGNVTGVTIDTGIELSGKRLQMLKEAVPSASTVALVDLHTSWEGAGQQRRREELEMGRRLGISLIEMPVQESTPSEFRRVFATIEQARPDAIYVRASPPPSVDRRAGREKPFAGDVRLA